MRLCTSEQRMQNRVPFEILPGHTLDIKTDGTGDFHTGSIELVSDLGSDSSLIGTEIFELQGNFVSVPSSGLFNRQELYISVDEQESTGIALYNPNDSPVTITLTLLNASRLQQSSLDIELGSNQQIARFVDEQELFKDYFN